MTRPDQQGQRSRRSAVRAPRPLCALALVVAAACSIAAPARAALPPGVPPALAPTTEAAAPAIESRPLGAQADAAPSSRPASSSVTGAGGWWRAAGALAIVLGLILGLRFVVQRAAGRVGGLGAQIGPAGRAPSGVLEVLGRFPVTRGQTLVLLRMDRRILLLGQSASGFSTLAEVTDAEEVASLLIKTRDDEGATQAAHFSAILRNLEREPATAQTTVDPADLPTDLREPERVAEPETSLDPAGALRQRLIGLRGASA